MRRLKTRVSTRYISFNSRTPGGVRLSCSRRSPLLKRFQFTHPGRGATTTCPYINITDDPVSIHAPREGCDEIVVDFLISEQAVSIHAPREGCDIEQTISNFQHSRFNSRTPGGVRLTEVCKRRAIVITFQFTHPGRGATTISIAVRTTKARFNSRTPGGVRRQIIRVLVAPLMFQFTHPGRGATDDLRTLLLLAVVSIHAPREGCDKRQAYLPSDARGFNSRTPGGVRRG